MKALRILSFTAIAFLSFLATGCLPDDKNTPTPNDPVQDIPSADFGLDKQKMLNLINAQRAAGCNCGTTYMPPVPALTWNNRLATAAWKHSKDMHDKNYFDHTSKDGREFDERITAEGYIWKSVGENIATGYTSEEEVMQGWMASPGHCKNIMEGKYTEIGGGRVGNYWTQDFGKPK
jgi:uncharacterized protein YkwD